MLERAGKGAGSAGMMTYSGSCFLHEHRCMGLEESDVYLCRYVASCCGIHLRVSTPRLVNDMKAGRCPVTPVSGPCRDKGKGGGSILKPKLGNFLH